jgi:DNA-binding winged helix-turn-helix (wHTH) protein
MSVPTSPGLYTFDNLTVDHLARQVFLDDMLVHLTRTEFDLLAILLSAPRRVFTRQQMMIAVWGSDGFGLEHSITVHMSNLRRKVGDRDRVPPLIRTLHGVGYRLDGHTDTDRSTQSSLEHIAAEVFTAGDKGFDDQSTDASFNVGGIDDSAGQLVTLEFDDELRLVSVRPHSAFCGWSPDDLIGRFYSPDPDYDEARTRAMIMTLLNAGLTQAVGTTVMRCANGTTIQSKRYTHLHLRGDGSLAGYTTRLIVAPERAPTPLHVEPPRPDPAERAGGGVFSAVGPPG